MHTLQAKADHLEDIMQNEWLSPREKQFGHAERGGLLNKLIHLFQRHALTLCSYIGLGDTVATGEIAIVVRIYPQSR